MRICWRASASCIAKGSGQTREDLDAMTGKSIFDIGLEKGPANHRPLTPLSLIERAATTFPDHIAVIHGKRRTSWSQTYRRCRQLASALTQRLPSAASRSATRSPSWRPTSLNSTKPRLAFQCAVPCLTRSTRGSIPRT